MKPIKLLQSKIILQAINNARCLNAQGLLPKNLHNATKPDFWKSPPKSSIEKKNQIIHLAKTGKPKPTSRLHPLRNAYSNYTNPSHRSYDQQFIKLIKTIRPEWFRSSSEENKQKLIKLAKTKSPRPTQKKTPLGSILSNYINPIHGSYDPLFTKKIKSLAPHWFISRMTIAQQKKQELIKLAKNKQPRPIYKKDPLSTALISYMSHNNRSFDPIFTKKIKALAPHWFIKKSNIKKEQLLKLAINKHPRPINILHPLGSALSYYTTTKSRSYDPIFTKKIKSIAPHWFISKSDLANQKKEQLLNLAKTKQPKPQKPKKLYFALTRYITKSNVSSFDPIFTKKIKTIAPHWFKK